MQEITTAKGIDVDQIVRSTQPICFENAIWAYTVGCAIAIKKGCVKAADAAAAIGEGLQSFCIPGSVAENRKVGLGHGNLGKMLLSEETECFCFLAGHESFAAAEGAIKIALNANKVRNKTFALSLTDSEKTPLISSRESTASPIAKPSLTPIPSRLPLKRKSHFPRATAPRSNATEQTMFPRALPS